MKKGKFLELKSKEYRDGAIVAAVIAMELFIKVFGKLKIEPIKALDLVMKNCGLSQDELDEVEATLKVAAVLARDSGEFSPLDVFMGIIIKLVEKADIPDEVLAETTKETIVEAVKSTGVVN